MKKLIFLFAIALSVLFWSCQEEQLPPIPTPSGTSPTDSSNFEITIEVPEFESNDTIYLEPCAYEKLHCYNFVEKPFDTDKVRQMVAHCLKFPGFQEEDKTLYFRKDGIVLAVDRSDIVYAESVNHIMYIHTRRSDTLEIPYLTLKRLLDEADSPDIIQCSRSAIINKRFVHNVDMTNRIIQLRDNYGRVEIGLMYKKLLKEIFK